MKTECSHIQNDLRGQKNLNATGCQSPGHAYRCGGEGTFLRAACRPQLGGERRGNEEKEGGGAEINRTPVARGWQAVGSYGTGEGFAQESFMKSKIPTSRLAPNPRQARSVAPWDIGRGGIDSRSSAKQINKHICPE